MLGRTLNDMTQLLESADGADARVGRVLELLRDLVPFEQCAVLDACLGHEPHIVVVPELLPAERVSLAEMLLDIFGQLVDAGPRPPASASRPGWVHLTVPLVGLDELVGLLMVRSSTVEYTHEHLSTLSLVAAKLAAYLTTVRARDELAALALERDQARHAAEAAGRAKDEFLALVSHELKTPLTAILAWSHLLRSTSDDAAARARAIDELERNVQTQSQLIDGILELAFISSAELRLSMRVVEPAALITSTLETLRREAEKKSIRLESELEATEMPLAVDPDRIGQVVSILVGNAIHSTPAGGRVDVRLVRATNLVRIEVSDGGGISGDALAHVFDRFPQQTGAGAGPEPGLGVGLAIVKNLVELHGGQVRAESAGLQQGATFTFELPRTPGTPPLAPAEHADARLLSGVRVLFVEHDLALRESFHTVLTDYGAEVTVVASAPEALASLDRQQPDVLLFGDVATFGDSVYGVMREVTAHAFPLPVASLSAWRLEEKERELVGGFRLHFTKPLAITTLVDAVAELDGRIRPPRSIGGKAPRLFAVPNASRAPKNRSD